MRRPAAGRKDRDKFISAEEQAERREGGGCHGLWRAPAVLLARPSLPAALTLLTPGSWPWSPGDAASWTPGGEPRRSVAASPSERGGLRVAAVNAVRIGRGSAEWVVTLPFPSEQGNNTAFRAECGHFGESVVADSPVDRGLHRRPSRPNADSGSAQVLPCGCLTRPIRCARVRAPTPTPRRSRPSAVPGLPWPCAHAALRRT